MSITLPRLLPAKTRALPIQILCINAGDRRQSAFSAASTPSERAAYAYAEQGKRRRLGNNEETANFTAAVDGRMNIQISAAAGHGRCERRFGPGCAPAVRI